MDWTIQIATSAKFNTGYVRSGMT